MSKMQAQQNQEPRQMTINTTRVAQIALVVNIVIHIAQADSSNHLSKSTSASDLNLLNPVVWDSNSLYKTKSEILHKDQAGRWKRSVGGPNQSPQQQFVDACESKMEVLTPYYATNSQGKLRTVINSELMQQAIQVETCSRSPKSQSAAKCNAQLDCGCEQKYKWHRLLVMDPSESGLAKGLFMDWFLFPSNCVCRCKSSPTPASKHAFMRAIKKVGE